MLQLFRGRNQRNKSTCKAADWDSETLNQPLDAVSDVGQLSDMSCRAPAAEAQSTVLLSSEQRDMKKVVIFPVPIHFLNKLIFITST